MTMSQSQVYSICDTYLERYADLDPNFASESGIRANVDTLTDISPAGHDARNELARAAHREMESATISNDRDRVAAGLLRERLQVNIDRHELGEHLRDLRTLGSAMQGVRETFDLMALNTDDDWDVAARRMRAVPAALAGFQQSLELGVKRGLVSAVRQAEVCARQARDWGGLGSPDSAYFRALAHTCTTNSASLQTDVRVAADLATAAFGAMASFLTDSYLPHANLHDAVGPERYAVEARGHCGIELDLQETYEWGWAELARIEHAVRDCCNRIVPGETYAAVVAHLERDDARAVHGAENLRVWLQELIDQSISDLNGTHFDIAAPMQRCEAMIAPPGGAAAMYYTPPSEDFSRPGRTWYPTMGNTRFPKWREVSICYHEAVPGHHLQLALVRHLSGQLSNYQRLLGWVSGHGEGWALYAERLMGVLGYLSDPAYELGMLAAQAMRAVRVIVDIGMHLELRIPLSEPDIGGQRWTPQIALPFVIERSRFPEKFMTSEVDRYLGLPGQAISYKVGERVWLESRDDAKRRHGPSFDLKQWHAYGLRLGPVGLETLATEMARF